MLRILGNRKTLCNGVTRRDLLHIGGLGAFGFMLGDLFGLPSAQASSAVTGSRFGQAKSCILIYKYGSPAQHETFDPKPDAPVEVQGEMQAIGTAVPGINICEHLPQIAEIADRLTFARSLTHPFPLHGMARGHVVGATDKIGGDVVNTPISPKDVLATAFHLLGIDPETTVPDTLGRPTPITGTGRFRPELLGV